MRRIVTLLLLLLLVSCSTETASPPANLAPNIAPASQLLDSSAAGIPDIGQPAPNFSYTLPNGATTKLSDLRGKKVIVNFWATWCGPCRAEMPDLQRIQQEYGDRVAVIGINYKELPDKLGPFSDDTGARFPLVADPQGAIASRYAARNMPTTYFIDTSGNVAVQQIGAMDYDFIKQQIERLK